MNNLPHVQPSHCKLVYSSKINVNKKMILYIVNDHRENPGKHVTQVTKKFSAIRIRRTQT